MAKLVHTTGKRKLESTPAPQSLFTQYGAGQIRNRDQAFVFQTPDLVTMRRFLILGSEKNTVNVTDDDTVSLQAPITERAITNHGKDAVDLIVEVAQGGLALKMDATIYAYALTCSHVDLEVRQYALAKLGVVCKIFTHLYMWAGHIDSMRGWGPGLRRYVCEIFKTMPLRGENDRGGLTYQVLKYGRRGGKDANGHDISWGADDLLRLAHPVTNDPVRNAVFSWMLHGGEGMRAIPTFDAFLHMTWTHDYRRSRMIVQDGERIPEITKQITYDIRFCDYPEAETALKQIWAVERLKGLGETDIHESISLIRNHAITHDMVPTELKRHKLVWEALIEDMPLQAMITNLGKMTDVGVFDSPELVQIAEARLRDVERIRRARLHPYSLLRSWLVYRSGAAIRGKLTWAPKKAIVDALEAAFYLAFQTVEPTNKRRLICLDVSGSMDQGQVGDIPGLSPRMAAACMAMVSLRSEPSSKVMVFSKGFFDPDLRVDDNLAQVSAKLSRFPFEWTDCSLPMKWALAANLPFDSFEIYTDNDVNHGSPPAPEIVRYRQHMKIDAKFVVVAFQASNYSIGDPADRGTLNVVGCSPDTPRLIADFVSGRI